MAEEQRITFRDSDGEVHSVPVQYWGEVLKADPKAVKIESPSSIGVAGEALKQTFKQMPRDLANALEAPGQKMEELSQTPGLRKSERRILQVGSFLAPKNDLELGLTLAGEAAGPILKGAAQYGERVGPWAAKTFLGAPKVAAETISKNPEAVNELAKLGSGGVMKKAVQFLGEARTKLSGLIKNSNTEYNLVQKEAIEATKGAPVIPINRALGEATKKAAELGFEEGVPLSDRAGMSVIKRAIQSYDQAGRISADGSKRIGFDAYNKLRVMLNAAMSNPRLSNQTRAVLQTLKEGVDAGMQEGLKTAGLENLAPKYLSTVENAARVRSLKSVIEPVLNARNAPQQIAKEIESGSEIGQALEEFDSLTGGGLKDVKNAVGAEFFSSKAPIDLRGGSSEISLLRTPVAAGGLIPFVGPAVFSPKGIASGASLASKAVKGVRPGMATVFSRGLTKKNAK